MAGISAFARSIQVVRSDIGKSIADTMAATARAAFRDAQTINARALGREPPFRGPIVDGREGAALETVKAGGSIAYTFAVGSTALRKAVTEAAITFRERAAVGGGRKDKHPGLYRDSLLMLVNGEQHGDPFGELAELKDSDKISLTDLQPYSRKIEIRGAGITVKAPRGLMEIITQVLRREYTGLLNIAFSYEAYPGFETGSNRKGGTPRTKSQIHRASRFPTIRLSVKV
jgi:hypothetical protein